jgi:hypothetical protein
MKVQACIGILRLRLSFAVREAQSSLRMTRLFLAET